MKYIKVIFLNPSYLIFCNNNEYNPYKEKVKFCGCCCCCKKDPTDEERLKDQLKNIDKGKIIKKKVITKSITVDGKEYKFTFFIELKSFLNNLKTKTVDDLKSSSKKLKKLLNEANLKEFNKKNIRDNIKEYIKCLITKKTKNEELNEEDQEEEKHFFEKNIYFEDKSLVYIKYGDLDGSLKDLIDETLNNSDIKEEKTKKDFENFINTNYNKCKNKVKFENLTHKTDKYKDTDINTVFSFAILEGDRRDDIYNLLFNFKNLDESKLSDKPNFDDKYLDDKCLQYKLFKDGANNNTNLKLEKINDNNYKIKFDKITKIGKIPGISKFKHNVVVDYNYEENNNECSMIVKSDAKGVGFIKGKMVPDISVNIIYHVCYNENFNSTFINVYSRISFKYTVAEFVKIIKENVYNEATKNFKLYLNEEHLKKIEDEEYLENLKK